MTNDDLYVQKQGVLWLYASVYIQTVQQLTLQNLLQTRKNEKNIKHVQMSMHMNWLVNKIHKDC